MPDELKLFTGNANIPLAREIADYLDIKVGDATVGTFSDGEINVKINENVRGTDVFVVQPTSSPVNNHLMELLIMMDAFKRASARRITAVIPYYGYGRQDRKVQPRVPITSRLVADLITTAGADRVLTVDLHAGQIQGFFDVPVDNLFATPVLFDHLRANGLKDPVVISPDAGGVERARAFSKRLGGSIAIIDKRRSAPNVAEVMNIIGEVEGRDALILDDMIDTAGTITKAVAAIKAHGARKVVAACTHAVLSGPAITRLNESELDKVICTNTIALDDKQKECPKLAVLTVAPLLGEAIRRIHEEASVSSLFT
ncbi:MAG TPA: ribose-phosphate pyrophosphokinase [Nitrospirota bacterium]|nr:ribose-phosphate pyrophosphokinase [Nitrospirota bacterium]